MAIRHNVLTGRALVLGLILCACGGAQLRGVACDKDSECPEGNVCGASRLCEPRPARDAGSPDAGAPDAGPTETCLGDGGPCWEEVSSVHSPSARQGAGFVYDAVHGDALLCAGIVIGAPLRDTWEWSGADWTNVTPAAILPDRGWFPMVYDSVHGVAVLFGGYSDFMQLLNDTWVWSGNVWTKQTPSQSPSAREGESMAFDSARGVGVMFSGDMNGFLPQDTWEWDGTNWTVRSPAASPSARTDAAMAYDSARMVTVLFGGTADNNSVHALNDTWEWDGTNWTEQTPANAPSPRTAHAMAYDSARSVAVLFGGIDEAGNPLNDTWEWDGTNWTQLSFVVSPPARFVHSMTFDSDRNVVVLFGGLNLDTYFTDTWELFLR